MAQEFVNKPAIELVGLREVLFKKHGPKKGLKLRKQGIPHFVGSGLLTDRQYKDDWYGRNRIPLDRAKLYADFFMVSMEDFVQEVQKK